MYRTITIKYYWDVIGVDVCIMDHKYCGCGEEHYKIKVEKSYDNNFNKEIIMDNKYLENIYQKLVKMNFNELFQKSYLSGLDGTELEIIIDNFFQSLSIKIYCYDVGIKRRGLIEINRIVNRLFKLCEINKSDVINMK